MMLDGAEQVALLSEDHRLNQDRDKRSNGLELEVRYDSLSHLLEDAWKGYVAWIVCRPGLGFVGRNTPH